MENRLKVSIITATMNSQETIEKSIKSLINQTYKEIELIIIDGGSDDQTLEIIKKYNKYITKIISESDEGIYHALNKGLSIATGDVIGFLHSDDKYHSSDVVETVVKNFNENKTDCVIGDLLIISPKDDKVVRYYRGSNNPIYYFSMGIMPPHPTVFLKKSIYEKFGDFNTKYQIASDYELLYRLIVRSGINYHYIPQVFIDMNTGGISTKNFYNKLQLNYEIFKIHKFYGNYFNPVKKLFYRMLEYHR